MNSPEQKPAPAERTDAVDARFFEKLALAALNGKPRPWPAGLDWDAERRFLDYCRTEGVAPLVHHRLRQPDLRRGWPESLLRSLKAEAAGNELLLTLNLDELTALLNKLDRARLEALLLKGAALSLTHYPAPHLRPREDTDLLVREADAPRVEQILAEQGYRKAIAHTGQLIMFQSCFRKDYPNGFSHTFDVHWKISNAQLFARSLTFEELRERAVGVGAALPSALAPSPAHGLLLACMHRVGHHRNSTRLIWLYDAHLMAEKMTEREQLDFFRLAEEKQMCAVCLDGLRESDSRFGGPVSQRLVARLSETPADEEPGSSLLGQRGRLKLMLSDLKSVPGAGAKVRLAAEHLFPPPHYMLRLYSRRSRLTLPFLYVHRIARGLWGLLTR